MFGACFCRCEAGSQLRGRLDLFISLNRPSWAALDVLSWGRRKMVFRKDNNVLGREMSAVSSAGGGDGEGGAGAGGGGTKRACICVCLLLGLGVRLIVAS